MKVLIVEDDVVIAESLGNELSHWNYEVSITKQFDNILEEFKTAEPELVLLDINLPTFNGYHWCQEIRKVSNVPIIFISSRTTIWIKLWQFKWAEMTLLKSHLICHLL